MNQNLKDNLLEFGKKNNFQFVNLSKDSMDSKLQLEMLKEQDLDMYNIFGFDESSGIKKSDIAEFYDQIIANLNP